MDLKTILLRHMTLRGLSQAALSEKSGVNTASISDILGGKMGATDKTIQKLAIALSLTESEQAEMLIAARAFKSPLANIWDSISAKVSQVEPPSPAAPPSVQLPPEKFVIPVYAGIAAGSGNGHDFIGEPIDYITVNDEYRRMGVFALVVQGQSMIDDLFPGEYALFKPINGNRPKPTDICAVEVAGWPQWAVKFVEQDASGLLLLKSTNPAYKVFEKNPDEVKIKGTLIESRRVRRPPTTVAETALRYGP